MSFALIEMTLVTAMMSQRFVYDLVPGHPVEPEATLTLRPRHGLKMVARRRTPDTYGGGRMSPDHEVVVIGAGFSGIGASIRLADAGIDDHVLLEEGDDVGGTWYWNRYPGVAVDIPSFSYQFSFEREHRLVAGLRVGGGALRVRAALRGQVRGARAGPLRHAG